METFKKIEEGFVGVTMILVLVLLTVNIILRFFFSAGISWSEEFIRYAIIYITFIGGAICFRRGVHVGIDVFMEYLSKRGQKVLQIILNVLAIIFMVLLIKYGTDLVLFSKGTGQLAPALQIKMYWAYLAIPIGSLLSLIHLMIQTYGMVKKFSNDEQLEG